MNIERLTALAEDLEAPAPTLPFDMAKWGAGLPTWEKSTISCATAGCIAGDTVALFTPDARLTIFEIPEAAQRILDLDPATADALFEPKMRENYRGQRDKLAGIPFGHRLPENMTYADVTARQAAKVIRNLIATQTVDWSII